jgi:hypothetical protein
MSLRVEQPYNPLDKLRLAESVVKAMLERSVEPLPPPDPFIAAGIYAIYYTGSFEAYRLIAEGNRNGDFEQAIYVGKAIPRGGRRGGLGLSGQATTALYDRLREHAESIDQADNLDLGDFVCRYLAVDDIWIPLAENLLIEVYKPLWNILVDGFGNHDPGAGRYNQKRSSWDVLHPGRAWSERLQPARVDSWELLDRIHAVLEFPALAEAAADHVLNSDEGEEEPEVWFQEALDGFLRAEDDRGVV